MVVRRKSIEGMRFSRLCVSEFIAVNKHRVAEWLCVCDCGNKTVATTSALKSGHKKSCGCLHKDKISTMGGASNDREYNIWKNMLDRCENPKSISYERYGARGISVCERWHDYTNFIEDIGKAPSRKHSLDRVDNSKGYYKKNCTWSTSKEQSRNTRRNLIIEINGTKKCLAEWVEMYELNYGTILSRIRRGWRPEDAVTRGIT